MNDKRFKGKTYEELYKRDVEMIKDYFKHITPFAFKKTSDTYEYGGLWLIDVIQSDINTILNPNIYCEITNDIIDKKFENTFESENFTTNVGQIMAKYCFLNDDNILLFFNDKKEIVASFDAKQIRYVKDSENIEIYTR